MCRSIEKKQDAPGDADGAGDERGGSCHGRTLPKHRRSSCSMRRMNQKDRSGLCAAHASPAVGWSETER